MNRGITAPSRSPVFLKWGRKEVKVEEIGKEEISRIVKKGKRAFLSGGHLVIEGIHFIYRKPLRFHLDLEGEVPLWAAPLLFDDVVAGYDGALILSREDYVLRVPVSVGKPSLLPTGGEKISLPRKVAEEMGKLVPFCGEVPPFSAVYFDGERAVATDRFVLVSLTNAGGRRNSTPLLLPKEGVLLLSMLASRGGGDQLEGHFGEGWLRVRGEDDLVLFLVGGVFPKLDPLILGTPQKGVEVEVPLLKEALALAQKVGDLVSLTFGEEGALLEVNGHFGEYRRRFPWRQPGVAFTAKVSPFLLSGLLNLFKERTFINVETPLLYLWNEEGLFATMGTL